MASLGERWKSLRDRLYADARFHRVAAAFPLTRPIARSRSQQLFDLCAGFIYSQILAACVQLDLFEMLAEGPATADRLSERTGVPADRLERLLAGAAAVDLLERRQGGWGLGPLGAALRGVPGVPEMIRHHEMLYADLADPVALLRGGTETRLARYWGYAGGERTALEDDEAAPYSALMAASQTMIAEETLAAYPPARHHCLLDVGGGEGVFLAAAGRAAPSLSLRLFDLPAVAARAAERFAALGLAARARAIGGDFLRDPLPTGADLISLVRVLHDHDDAAAGAILAKARKALPRGGRLLLSEPMAGERRPNRFGDAYFGLYLLAMGAGRPRSPSALGDMLRDAGFGCVRRRRTRRPLLTSVLIADAA